MALKLNVSNSLEELAIHLNKTFHDAHLSVFQPQYVITQTEGMNNWLKQQVAASAGIAANLCFLKPNDFLYKVYTCLGGGYTNTFSANNMCWLLFKVLGDETFIKKFPETSRYYRDEEVIDSVKQMALAEKLSDLFDQYQVYRPELIENWNKASLAEVGEGDWQQYVWIKAKEIAGKKFLDKTLLGNDIRALLKDAHNCEELRSRVPEVHVFGVSILTAFHIQLLKELSEHINIHFYFLNPAPLEYWYDTVGEKKQSILVNKGVVAPGELTVGNALLTSWGSVIKDTFCLMFEHDEFLNTFTEVGVKEPPADSLLQRIQQDIFHNRLAQQGPVISDQQLADGSITIHSCYTIAREVEALYNYLVHLVDKREEKLSPRDIVVMVSDVDAYAPYIKAVFDNAPYRFPYTIADESFASSDTIVHALKLVLELTEENFNAERAVQLLDASKIRKRFGLSNIPLLRKMVDAANIRFGIEGDKENDTVYVSWKYGLQRIMYGICLGGEEEFELNGDSIFPLDRVEGAESHELIKFCHFVQALMEVIEGRKRARTLIDWVEYIRTVLEALVYEPGVTIEEDYRVLVNQLQAYAALNDLVTEKFSYDVFRYHFIQTLSSTTRSSLFGGGGITFCSLIPMRSIPFKVVALLGLNYDKFPRKETAASFNLLQQTWQRGDRNVKENDKHLFLETILSAKKYFYASYLGQSVKDNATIPPSALLDELVDYIEAGYGSDVKQQLIVRQPLHSFSRRYTVDGDRLYTYLIEKGSEAVGVINADKEEQDTGVEEISVYAFVNFFKNPFKTYYNSSLGIYYDEDSDLLSTTELFKLDGLQQWGLKNDLLTMPVNERERYKRRLLKQGRLPLKNMAEVSLAEVEESIAVVKDLYEGVVNGEEPSRVAIELAIDSFKITGHLENVVGTQLVITCFSKSECKYLIEAYLLYLIGRAAGVVESLHYISSAKEDIFVTSGLTQEEAILRVEVLLDLYQSGLSAIGGFYPDFGIKPNQVDDLELDRFKGIVKEKLVGYNSYCNDHYILNEYHNGFFDKEETLEEYKAACEILLKPLAEIFPTYYQ